MLPPGDALGAILIGADPEAAHELDVNQVTLAQWERREGEPGGEFPKRIERFFGVPNRRSSSARDDDSSTDTIVTILQDGAAHSLVATLRRSSQYGSTRGCRSTEYCRDRGSERLPNLGHCRVLDPLNDVPFHLNLSAPKE